MCLGGDKRVFVLTENRKLGLCRVAPRTRRHGMLLQQRERDPRSGP